MSARRGGFIRGLGGMFNFVDVINRRLLASSPEEADAEAIYSYWESVGGYLAGAMNDYAWEYRVQVNEARTEKCGQTESQKTPSPE